MKKRTFQVIAVAGLVPVGIGTFVWAGPPVASWLAGLAPDGPTSLLRLLGYLLALLGLILLWALAILPLRRLSDMPALGDELRQIKSKGLATTIRDEQARLEASKNSADPKRRARYHAQFTGIALLLTIIVVPINWALAKDGYLWKFWIILMVVLPILAIYHGIQAIRLRGHKRPDSTH